MPIYGILVREHPVRESFTNDNDRIVFAAAVGIVEVTPGEDWNAQGCEKPWGNKSHLRARILTGDVSVAICGKLKSSAKARVSPRSKEAKSALGHARQS